MYLYQNRFNWIAVYEHPADTLATRMMDFKHFTVQEKIDGIRTK